MTAGVVPAHSDAYRFRRFANWFPLGLAYAFLYMGRYNLTVAKGALGQVMTTEDFGFIFLVGSWVYGVAFLLNGPLTDKLGGRLAMLTSVFGSAATNLVMGLYLHRLTATTHLTTTFAVLFGVNMYFQSFGAVAIVKVNASWFHVRERGGFSGIFGTMISSGIFLAYSVNGWILEGLSTGGVVATKDVSWVFFTPAALLALIGVFEFFVLKDHPSQAGHADFDTGDGSASETGAVSIWVIVKRIFTNPVIMTIALVELCTGVLRQGVMQWTDIYNKEILVLPPDHYLRNPSWLDRWPLILGCFVVAAIFFVLAKRTTGKSGRLWISGGLVFLAPFLLAGWGGLLMVAGVIGGNVAGWVSDVFFQSRRAPAAGGLYALLAVASGLLYFTVAPSTRKVSWVDPKEADKAKKDGFDALAPGDELLTIAGTEVSGWKDVQRAVACVPVACKDSTFDTAKCLCTSDAKSPYAGPAPVPGPIVAKVIRGGVETELRLRDPGAKMRAGDQRKLRAGPVPGRDPMWMGLLAFVMSLCVIGTHGLLSGTATMDFGGKRGAATAVGIIDGFVYLGSGIQAIALGEWLIPKSWSYWPLFMMPFAVVGFLLITRVWHAKPGAKGGGH